MIPGFDWDPRKRESNLEKHGIDFIDAAQIFGGFVLRRRTPLRPDGEERVLAIGVVAERLVTVTYTLRGATIRIISARRANGRETRAYRAVRPKNTQEPDGLGPG